MKIHILHILLIFTLVASFCEAQQIHFTDAQREQQRQYIRRDTLPVTANALPTVINSPFSEYNGRMLPDSSFYFTAMRSDVEADYDHFFESSWYCKIYESRYYADGTFESATALPAIINSNHTFNSNFCFNRDHSLMLYSRCTRTATGELRCQLWQSERNKRGSWGKPEKLPANINIEGYSSMQPHLTNDADREILYFVTDRPGGIGGYDIWYAIKNGNSYTMPINAGPIINTEGNEVTPFYDTHSGTLYFSSDGHLGIGDYDIFYSQGALSQWGEVSNMGIPFNSDYNDYYFTVDEGSRSGFFSSNRPQHGVESDTCCNDLYRYQWIETQDTSATAASDTCRREVPPAAWPAITLYFENDQPDARTTADTTTADYATLYRQYVALLRGVGSAEAIRFMQDSVATGYEQMLQFTQTLRKALESGQYIQLTISGFASPLHHNDYNLHLSTRRIVSFLNYLRQAEDGFFIPYLQQQKKGLTVRNYPQGAVQHHFSSANANETVYGWQAMCDRKIRVEMKKVK